MDKNVDETLNRLKVTLAALPDETQSEVIAEIEWRVGQLAESRLSDEQRAVVQRRKVGPKVYATADEVDRLLSRFDSNV